MKFSIQKNALIQLIQTVSKAVAIRTTKQVLSGILIETNQNKLTATAYDLELGIQDTLLTNEINQLQIQETGTIVLPARYFNEVIKKLPNDTVEIQVNNNYMTEIKSGTAEFHLHGIDSAEFPKLPSFLGMNQMKINSNDLNNLIRSTAFATSNSEVRPVLTGIFLTKEKDRLTFTATDGLRLATKSITDILESNESWSSIIPGKSLLELAKILPDDNSPILLQFSQSHSLFIIGSTHFYTRLIEGAYPDTSRIIPNDCHTEINISTSDILGAIDRAALIARDKENHMVRLEVSNETITISSNSAEIGNVSEKLQSIVKSGDDLLLAFNARYVIDALKAIQTPEVIIRFNGSNQPFVLREINNEHTLQLISPVLMR